MSDAAVESLFRRDSLAVAGALSALILLAWFALLLGAGTGMDPVAMSGWILPIDVPASLSGDWTPAYWLIVFFMWAAMMVAMMLPSASPTVLLYARLIREASSRRQAAEDGAGRVTVFASAYLLVWGLFSLIAAVLQWGLEHFGAMSALMNARVVPLAGGLLIAAGLYQLTPLKAACLKHCRGPAHFIAAHWRPGLDGAFRMGLAHGLYCLGCCGLLMLLLFVGGVMNLVWIAALSLLVAIEKLVPFGALISKGAGVLLMGAGFVLLATA